MWGASIVCFYRPEKESLMRSQIARSIRLSVLLLALVLGAAAQDAPTVTITPEAGEVEKAVFTIEIDGLQPDTDYEIEILFAGEVVFSSEETSDQAGHIPYPVVSTAGDAPGAYTLQVLLDGQVVASADFLLTAAAADAGRDLLGDVTASPETAPFGKAQKLRIAELKRRAPYTVEITARETLELVYRRQHTSGADGVIEFEVFAEEGDAAGEHTIAVYDEADELIAAGIFTILPRPQRDVSLTLSPSAVEAGAAVQIAVSGLAAFDSVTAQISTADGLLIDSVLARASSDGGAALRFEAPLDLAAGLYDVQIFVEGDLLAEAPLTISNIDIQQSIPAIAIDPPSGPIGTRHTIALAGLNTGGEFTLIILDPAGTEAYKAARQADDGGEFSLTISSTEDDDLGVYSVAIHADESGPPLISASFEITAAPDDARDADAEPDDASAPTAASATIQPQSAPIGSSHLITVRDLGANESVTMEVTFGGLQVYSSEKTADANGTVTLELITDDDDQPGDYSVHIRRARGNQPAVILTATAKPAAGEPATGSGDIELISGRLSAGSAAIEFDGQAGQYVLINVQSHDFDPAAALIDRDDVELAFVDDSRGQKDAAIGPLRLPYSGEYNLEISAAPLMMAQGAETGEFTATIMPVALAQISFDADVRFELSAEAPALYYALPVETGDSLTVTVDSGGRLDTQLQVVAPAGTERAFDDDSGAGFDAELSNLVFDRAATYVLVISSFEAGASGAGTVRVARNPVHSLDDGDVVVTLNDKAIRDLVVFDAAEDELLVLNLELVAGDVEDLYVTATIEGMEVMSYSTMGVPDDLPLAFVTPMSGRVVVTLEKFGFDDGITLDVSLERP